MDGDLTAVDDDVFYHFELGETLAQLRFVDRLQQLEDGILVERGVRIGHACFLVGFASQTFPFGESFTNCTGA